MSRFLVLDYSAKNKEIDWLEKIFNSGGCELQQSIDNSANDDTNASPCDGVLVVDDGNKNGVAALHSALRMRRNAPNLPIAIITPVSETWTESEAAVRGVGGLAAESASNKRLNTNQVRELFSGAERQDIDLHLSNDTILFEYQG